MSASNIDSNTKLPYNPKSAQSILDYGEKLLGHSLRDLHPDAIPSPTDETFFGIVIDLR